MAPTTIDPTDTLGELVNQRPARAGLFESLKLDYCCGGASTLADACEQRGLDAQTVCRAIEALDAAPQSAAASCVEDWGRQRASIGALCDHIVTVHHDALRRDLRLNAELLNSVMRVHGPVHLELRDLPRAYGALRGALEEHIETEERVLFPACRSLDDPFEAVAPALDEALLDAHEHDHREAGEALVALRELTGDYDTGRAFCRTHRRLLEGLQALELELHQHIHEENNVLFPQVRAALAGAGG